ncbi:hypothetical protein E1288_27525 [Saccharopolyspora elongata]|uniref:Uncharacterized protein n=2 Tax=Pseudonocardiaceae TaxID=2070 RepID=A0A4V2YKL0_9PSEU|nr:hypothetical protein E1288_27525 [Saccharopolyspora elongata]
MNTMRTPLRNKQQNRLAGIRQYLATQNRLWARHLDALQPWEQETELRWVRNPITRRWELRGGVLPG